jgi:hypothetical protein
MSEAAIVVGMTLIFIVGIGVWVLKQRERRKWLSHEVGRKLKSLEPSAGVDADLTRTDHLGTRFQELLASKRGPFAVLAIVVIIYALLLFVRVLIGPMMAWHADTWSSFLSDLWQVHASIIGVTFVVIVLLVEALGGKLGREHLFRLYIRESYIIPIALAGLIIAGSIGVVRFSIGQFDLIPWWLEALALSSLAIFVLFLVATAFLYWKTVEFLRPSWIRRARIRLAEQAVVRAVRWEIRQRLSHKILDDVCREQELCYVPNAYARRDLAPIRAGQFGVVADINLCKLAEFARVLTPRIQQAADHDRTYRGFLLRGIGSYLEPDNDVLVRVYADDQTELATQVIRSAYKISRSIEPYDEPLIDELRALKDEARAALRDRQPDAFNQILNFYRNLFGVILKSWYAYGIPATEVTAFPLPVMHSQLLWILERDLYDIFEFAISTQDRDLVSSAIYFPVRSALLALETDEQRLFARFVGFMPRIYQLVARDNENPVRDFVVDRSWRNLRTIVDYHLVRKLESDLTLLDELPRLGRYLVAAIRTFRNLLKAAVDARDQESFGQFGAALDHALQHYRPENAVTDHHQLAFRLQRDEDLSEEERQYMEQRLTRYQALVGIRKQAQQIRQAIWFGISSWLIREFTKGRIRQPVFATWFDQGRNHFRDLRELSSTYLAVRREDVTGLDWDSWVLFELPAGEVHRIDTESWMREFYCIQGLRLTPEDIGDEGTPVAPDRELESMLDSLAATCERLRGEQDLWRGIVSDQDLERIDHFLELHRRAIVIERHQQEEWLIQQPISQARWQAFQQAFLDSWRNNATVRALISRFGFIEDRTNDPPPEGMPAYGVNTLDDKAAYVEGWHVAYPDWGSAPGRQMANTEDVLVIPRIADGLAVEESVDLNDLVDRLVSAVEGLRGQGYNPSTILVDSERWFRRTFSEAEGFVPSWSPDCEPLDIPGFEGRLRSIPLVIIWRALSGSILVADFAALGRWIQYQMTTAPGEVFDFHLGKIDHEEAERLLDEHPEWLEDLGAETLEEGIWRLQQRVHLRILERFEYVVDDPQAGIQLRIREEGSTLESGENG